MYNWQIKLCRCLDSNCGSLGLEATALPTEPQPLLWDSHIFALWAELKTSQQKSEKESGVSGTKSKLVITFRLNYCNRTRFKIFLRNIFSSFLPNFKKFSCQSSKPHERHGLGFRVKIRFFFENSKKLVCPWKLFCVSAKWKKIAVDFFFFGVQRAETI